MSLLTAHPPLALSAIILKQRQAEDAGRRLHQLLRPDDSLQIYTSPYRRTRQTTEGILKTLTSQEEPGSLPSAFSRSRIQVHEEPRLREQDFGNFQPGSAEMERMWRERSDYGRFFYRIPNGESAADAYDRIAGFNESLWRQFGDQDFPSVCVLVTHGLMARVFLMKWYACWLISAGKNRRVMLTIIFQGIIGLSSTLKTFVTSIIASLCLWSSSRTAESIHWELSSERGLIRNTKVRKRLRRRREPTVVAGTPSLLFSSTINSSHPLKSQRQNTNAVCPRRARQPTLQTSRTKHEGVGLLVTASLCRSKTSSRTRILCWQVRV